MAVTTRVGAGLAVAVRAEKLEVLESVVEPVTVDVMQSQRQRQAHPLRKSTHGAEVRLQVLRQDPAFEVCAVPMLTGNEKLLGGRGLRSRPYRATPPRRLPCLMRKAERRDALAHTVPLVVVALDRRPVVPTSASFVHRHSKTTRVIRDCALAQAETPGGLQSTEPLFQQFGNTLARLDMTTYRLGRCWLPVGGGRRGIPKPLDVVAHRRPGQAELVRNFTRRAAFVEEPSDFLPCPAHEHMFAYVPDGNSYCATS